jgi:flagella basal body P-ring formation protein FlgA
VTALAFAALLASGETVVLKENARVGGRFVRLADLLDPEFNTALRTDEIYLGRAPDEGATRTITVDEIRRELDRRGMADALTFVGKRVEVTRGQEPETQSVRRKIASEVKRLLLEKNPNEKTDALLVTISRLVPESLPPLCSIAEIHERGVLEFSVILLDSDKNRIEAQAVARVLRLREEAFAARDIAQGKMLERGDLELRRVEATEESPGPDLSSLIGSRAAARIRKGAKVSHSEFKAVAAIRQGEIVRAVSSTFEVDARALEDGSAGQEILMEFAGSKNRFRARVSGAGRVEVVEGK